MAPIILVTGFEPFDQLPSNPTQVLANAVDGLEIGGFTVVSVILPVRFDACVGVAVDAIERLNPAAVLSLGLAAGRAAITPERIAVNVRSTRDSRPDNAGRFPLDEPISDGPDGIFATLPIRAMVADLTEAGLPAQISNTAGTYVCNTLMYGVLDHLRPKGRALPAGFVHVPATPDLAELREGIPSVTIEDLNRALRVILDRLVTTLRG